MGDATDRTVGVETDASPGRLISASCRMKFGVKAVLLSSAPRHIPDSSAPLARPDSFRHLANSFMCSIISGRRPPRQAVPGWERSFGGAPFSCVGLRAAGFCFAMMRVRTATIAKAKTHQNSRKRPRSSGPATSGGTGTSRSAGCLPARTRNKRCSRLGRIEVNKGEKQPRWSC